MKPQEFINAYKGYAIDTQNRYNVPASITMAQAIIESSWGESSLTKQANNFFGIKADTSWNGNFVVMQTREVFNGQSVMINSKFRKYSSPVDSFNDHAKFLIDNSRYANLFLIPITDYKSWAKIIKADGYATGLNYSDSLINLIEVYKLDSLDLEAIKKKS